MEENPSGLALHFLLRPIRVLGANPGHFHFPRRPVESLRQAQTLSAGHRAEDFYLFRSRLFIRKHEQNMRRKIG
jgi:hypothetical protein